MLKKILNCLMWFFIWLLVGTLVLTLINYFDILGNNVVSIMKFIIPLLIMFANSYRLGNMSDKLGYLEGLKFGGIVIFIFVIMVIILDKFSLRSILYYGILLLTSVMGSMIGINRKKASA